MTTAWVVPAFFVFKDCHAGLSPGAEYAAVNKLAFKGGEKAFRHSVGLSRRLHPIRVRRRDVSESPTLSILFAVASSN